VRKSWDSIFIQQHRLVLPSPLALPYVALASLLALPSFLALASLLASTSLLRGSRSPTKTRMRGERVFIE